MRALENWSFEETVEAHAVLDELERIEAQSYEDARKKAENEAPAKRRIRGRAE